tara:strand:+ start:12230 stop:12871 length:642 start_codon:yes stop_codon:yes gene_type:complete
MNKFKYRLFGRSKGRGKNTQISKEANNIKITKIDSCKYNVIDIGCGYGESTLEIAMSETKKNVIACEKYVDGINNIVKIKTKNLLNNISIFHGNVHQLFDEFCPKNSISEIWILFPDPWPKKKHNKRRLINENFLDKLRLYLKKEALIHIATDSQPYLSEILISICNFKNYYSWINQSKAEWDYSNLELPKTKYFQKAQKNGNNSFYLKLMKL